MEQVDREWDMDDGASSIVIISRKEEAEGEEENNFAPNPNSQTARFPQSSELPQEHSYPGLSATEEYPGENEGPLEHHTSAASPDSAAAVESPRQIREHDNPSVQAQDTSPDLSSDHEEPAETAWPPDQDEPQGQKSPEEDNDDEEYNEDGVSDIDFPPSPSPETPPGGRSPAQSPEPAEPEQPPDREKSPGHESPRPSSEEEGEEGGQDSTADIELTQHPPIETPPRDQFHAQGLDHAPPDGGNMRSHHPETPSPGSESTESVHSPAREDNVQMQTMTTPPQGSTPSYMGPQPPHMTMHGQHFGYGGPGPQPPGAWPVQLQSSGYTFGEATPPRGPTPTQGQPRYLYSPPPGYQSPTPELIGAGSLPMKGGFQHDSTNHPPPRGPTPTWPSHHVDPRYFHGFPPGYSLPPGQSPVQDQFMQQMSTYGNPYLPPHGPPGSWSVPPPQYSPPTQTPPPVQRPSPVKLTPTRKPGGPSRGPGKQGASALTKGTATPGVKTRGRRQPDSDEDDIRPEDSISSVGIPRVQMSVAEKLHTWKQDKPEPLPDPGHRVLQVKRVPESASEDDVADFFEHKKRGGFDVEKVDIDKKTRTALVSFKDPSGVKAVLESGPHMMDNRQLNLAVYSPGFEEEEGSNSEHGHILHVTGLPADADEDDVADYFEHKKRGGFRVEKVELRPQSSSALVFFQSAKAVEAVLRKGPFAIRKKRVEAEPYSPADAEQTAEEGCILEVSGVPEDMDEEDVADFFENKRRGGFEVIKVEIDEETQIALVYFDDPAALEGTLQKAPFIMQKAKISVKAYVPEKDPRFVLHVTGLPEDVDEDDLADFFENKKRGGFSVDRVELDERTRSAKVHFEDASAVGTILQKAPLKIQKTQIEVKQYVPPKKKDYNRMLLVRGLPSNADVEDVADFFENKRRGGHIVEQVDLFPKQRTAVVYFEKSEAISFILGKPPFKMSSRELDVCKCTARALKTLVQTEECTQEEEENKEETQEDEPCFVLQVADLPGSVSEETLTNFFENRKNSGGCKVSRVELNRASKTALVYFEDPTAVETILQRAPFLINKKKVSVSAYVPAVATAAQGRAPGKTGEEEEESCVVAVKGYGGVTVDTLEMYFENTKKSGGQDIQSCTKDEKKEVVYITFKSPQVAKRVSEKTDHTLGKRTLTVSLHKARPTCPDRVLLTGLPIQVSRENLVNFLEARTKLTPKDILFGEAEGTALVVFDKDYDMMSLENALKQRKLEGSEVKARPVTVSDTVLVRDVSPSVSKDTLELYFDNARKSGGEGVQRVEKLGEGNWLVTFADYQVASKVSERSHRLGSGNLQLSLYVDCLGPGGGDRDPCNFPLPPPLSVSVPHPFLLRFLRESPSQGQALKEMLAQRHAHVKLDDVAALKVTCTLTRETPQGKRLAKTWTEDVQTAVRDFLDRFQISEVQMTATVFAEVEKEKKKIQPPAEKAMIFSEPASSTFVVIGEPKVVEQTSKAISDLKKQHEAELERKKQTVTEAITLKKHQLKYLEATKFLDDMRKQKGLKIDLDVQANKVVFTGLFSHVKDTQLKMFEFVQNLSSDKIKISKTRGVFLQKNPVASFVLGRLREKKLVAVWELTDNEFTLWAATDQDVVQAAHVIKAAVQERTLNLDPESVALLSSKEWSDLVKRIEDQDGRVLIAVDKARAEVVLTAVEDRMAAAVEDMRNFFLENAVYKQKLSFPPGRQSFMTEHLSSKIHELETNNRAYGVSITFSKGSSYFKLEGTKVGLARVVDGLTALGASISQEKHTLNDKALAEFIKSSRGKESLTLVQSTGRCVIRRKGDPTDQPTLTGAGASTGTSQSGIYRLGGSVILRVTQGDLTKLKVDALVNSANDRLRHVGGLARAISDRAGQSLQKECEAYVSQHGPLKEGEVMVSGAGNLTCKNVIHAVGPRYQGGQNGEEDKLKAAVKGSLKEAHTRGLTSIAMPAISCGVYGYPVKDASQVIVEAMMEFFRDLKTSSLREVVLCDNSPDTLTHFHQAAKVLTPLNPDDLEDDEPVGGRPNETGGARPRYVRGSSRDHETSGGVGKARAVLGEMALQTVDVIVNTTSSSLNLTHGTVSASLLKAAGPQLQDEVNARYPQGLPPGQHFAVTSAGRLQAKRVYHTSLPDWGNGGEKFLRKLLEKCVKEADSQGFSSIAFPALGTGVLSYPRDVVVRHFKEVASSLLPACRSLREIRIVIFPRDTTSVKAFESMMDEGESTGASVNNLVSMQRKPSRMNRSFWTKPTRGTTKSRSAPTQPRKAAGPVHAFHINDVVLRVKMGNLVEEDVEAIVNSTNSRIDLKNGAVANAILAKCGQKLVDECNKPKKQSSMKSKGLTVTSSHGLQSQKIIHVDGDFFKGQWTDVITACLVKANKHKLARVAFPALGTGNRTLKPADSAMAFIDAIKVMQKSQVKTVKEVRVVIYQPEMFAAFVGTIQKVMTTAEAQSKGWFTKMFEYFAGETSPDGAMGTGQVEQASGDPSVTLYLFSDRPAEIQQALEQIKKMYDTNITKQEIQHEMIKKFSEAEQNMIRNLEEAFKVQAVVDTGRSVVTLKGFSQGVIHAVNEVHKILRDLEQERHLEEGAEVVSNYVQWCYLDESDATTQRKDYDKKTNAVLEKEFQKQSSFTKIPDDDGFVYVFNFNDMEEFPEDYPDDKVKLLRRDLLQKSYHHALPESWAHMKDDEELKVVSLAPTDSEYVDVETEFKRTLNRSNITVTKIERIQNRTLHDQYLAKKQAMEKQNPPGTQNERKLWHGTAENAIVSINHYGFNRSYCGKNAVIHGSGVYFAVNSNYSTRTTYSPAVKSGDKSGDRHIYYVRVLTGEFTMGASGMRVPPAKKGHVLYDSVVNNMNHPAMYIVFNDTQAYPDYLITFRGSSTD